MHGESREPDVSAIPDSSRDIFKEFEKHPAPGGTAFENVLAELNQTSKEELVDDLARGGKSAEASFNASKPRILTEDERKAQMQEEEDAQRRRETGEDL
jgi:hypothetical protein